MKSRLVCFVVMITFGSAFLLLCLSDNFDDPRVLPTMDFLEYWSAGRVLANGGNPYDGAAMMSVQTSAGREGSDPVMMWNPPWTLPICMILGWFPWRISQCVWLQINLVCILFSSIRLWTLYRGADDNKLLVILSGLAFTPTFYILFFGQISGLLLAGGVGFLVCVRAERWWLAGVLASLTSLKPHLFMPFAAILFFEAIRGTPIRKSVVAGAFVLALGSSIPLIWNSNVWSEYWTATFASEAETHLTLRNWFHPTLGHAIRLLWPGHPFFVTFLPLLLGLPLVLARYWFRRRNWNWLSEFPSLILISLAMSPYGAWMFDLVVLFVPILSASSRLSRLMNLKLFFYLCGAFVALNIIGWYTTKEPISITSGFVFFCTIVGYFFASIWCRKAEHTCVMRI